MRTKLIATLAACGLAVSVIAAEGEIKPAGDAKNAGEIKPVASAKPQAAPTEDIQDLIFLNDSKLMRFRMHIQVDGKPASLAWQAFIDKVFAYYDRNDDKFLSPQEAARVTNPAMFSQGIQLLFNGRGGRQGGNNGFAAMDTNKDGKVSLDEFRAYAKKTGFAPVQVQILPPNGVAQQLTDAFYKQVNAKADGKLTKADLMGAWDKLCKLDMDEDEIISAQELRAQPAPSPYQTVEFAYDGMARPQQQAQSPFFAVPTNADEAATAIMARLDAERRALVPGAVMRFTPGAPKVAQTALRNADLEYVKTFLAQPADLELTVMLGNIAEGVGRMMSLGSEPAGVKTTRVNGKASPLESVAKTGADGLLRVTLPDSLIECGRAQSNGNRFDGTAQYYLQQFKMLAGEKKYVEKQDLTDNGQLQFFLNVFDDLDRNGDGKLTIAELQAGFDMLDAGTKCQAYITVVDQGRGIFDLIDANHDNRLSRRELLNAVKRFDEFDKNKDGVIERSELLAQFRITASQGVSNGNFRVAVSPFAMQQTNRTATTKGPMWFRKMDKNGDGDVSAREFLGTPEEFKEIDTNGDGLISSQEAEAYDAKMKQKVATK